MNNITVQQDIRTILDNAMEAPKGLKLTLPSEKRAWYYRQRCYQARHREREKHKKIHGENYVGIPWDDLIFIILPDENECHLFITHDAEFAAALSDAEMKVEVI